MPIRNVIVYSRTLPPEYVGGMETNAYNLIRYLAIHSKLNIAVVSQKKKLRRWLIFKEDCALVSYGGTEVMTHYRKKKFFKRTSNVVGLLASLGFDSRETVIFHNSLDLHPHYCELQKAGYAQVARSGGNDIFFMQGDQGEDKAFQRHVACLDRFFVNSQYSYRRTCEVGVPASLLEVVKGGCEIPPVLKNRVAQLGLPADRPIIITCGRLVDFKGVEDALDALALLKQRGERFFYLIVGDGEDRSSLQERAARLGLQDDCRFYGKVSPDDIYGLYQCADVYLSTSKSIVRTREQRSYVHTETMGRSICEAQANGVPVVTTDAGGAPEMVKDGVTGIVVPEGDVANIADAVHQLLSDKARRDTYARAALAFATRELSWETVFSRYVDALERVRDSVTNTGS